jgi:Fe2+ transport system protein FeoA
MESNPLDKESRAKKACSLSQFPGGFRGTIVDVMVDAQLQGRLMGMGLFVGTRFQLLQHGTIGSQIPFLLAIGETRIAIGWDIAERILVEP